MLLKKINAKVIATKEASHNLQSYKLSMPVITAMPTLFRKGRSC